MIHAVVSVLRYGTPGRGIDSHYWLWLWGVTFISIKAYGPINTFLRWYPQDPGPQLRRGGGKGPITHSYIKNPAFGHKQTRPLPGYLTARDLY